MTIISIRLKRIFVNIINTYISSLIFFERPFKRNLLLLFILIEKKMNEKIPRSGVTYFDEITYGMSAEVSRIISQQDVISFAEVTGDMNPIHIDVNYASNSIFGQRVAHGMLVAGFISAVFGSNFPGTGWIYVDQSLQFKRPVFINDEVKVAVTVERLIPEKRMVNFGVTARVANKTVITGDSTLLSPRRHSD